MVDRFPAPAGRLYENGETLLEFALADELVQGLRTQPGLELIVLGVRRPGEEPFLSHERAPSAL